eukprot:CAMPEP_0176004596 /NCGR_PEP_ID=MMETSP0120_2-20121206/1774_1 /TAXON_ID=160619 /ORGANISM="Kryptoperidinium foliaceum, Strain CCMP 1326" /LENGTH=294 /DNA_ID=CAMNT_0017337281 /DNA_START=195 /DNA_END=1080 /DNA_ORIENTATION=-
MQDEDSSDNISSLDDKSFSVKRDLSSSAKFGDVVPLSRSKQQSPSASDDMKSAGISADSLSFGGEAAGSMGLANMRKRNTGVAILSIALAVLNYLWQYLHPLQPIQLLYQMEQKSSPITVIGTTNKPTVVDFWAPWCENCKLLAPTLLQVEEEFGKDLNFVMINGDDSKAWPLIEAFGVDAIPHLALVEADGTVDTALIGPVPKQWLVKDLQVLKENAANEQRQSLPYQMLDVFANRPDQRRIQVQKSTTETLEIQMRLLTCHMSAQSNIFAACSTKCGIPVGVLGELESTNHM